MSINLERLQPRNPGATNTEEQPKVAVYKSGKAARINAAALKQWFDGVDEVAYYVDPDGELLAIERDPEHDDAYSVTTRMNGGVRIASSPFFRAAAVAPSDIDETVHLELQQDVDSGLIIAELAPLQEAADVE